jgi:hypothetical protein
MDQWSSIQALLREVMILCRSASGVNRFTPGGPRCLHFYSHSLVGPIANENERELWNLHRVYGASPRDLFNFTDQPVLCGSIVNPAMNELSPEPPTDLFRHASNATDTSCFLISSGPLPLRLRGRSSHHTSSTIAELADHSRCCRDDLRAPGAPVP